MHTMYIVRVDIEKVELGVIIQYFMANTGCTDDMEKVPSMYIFHIMLS
jgi:hypothetical protein